ncbi:hypothetical protein [Streptomyces sp. NPDC088763]|uniref:MmyB family transcriptional regulator n=1 Tax=Streptomyces sp. NPDC088763 TaxID=3365892 RepID=UPI0037F12B3C
MLGAGPCPAAVRRRARASAAPGRPRRRTRPRPAGRPGEPVPDHGPAVRPAGGGLRRHLATLYWNPLFAATFGEGAVGEAEDGNVLLWQFLAELPRVRQSPSEREAFEESLIADLRATTSRYPGDPDVEALITKLGRSPRFRELWSRGAVGGHESALKRVEHPQVGEIALLSDILTTAGGLRLVVFTPQPGTDARSKLDLLGAVGLQTLSTVSE